MSSGAERIAEERDRQIREEGYGSEHDRHHVQQLIQAARVYSQYAGRQVQFGTYALLGVPSDWPWSYADFKLSGDPVRDLEKAGALIAAAIDAIQAGREEQ